jgi:hypothetical protein
MPPGTGPLRAVLDCLAAGTSVKNVNLGAFWGNIIMLFMLVSRAKPGTKREQLVDRLTHEMHGNVGPSSARKNCRIYTPMP